MKYVLVIGDGIADEPVEALGLRTPLQTVDCPAINTLAGGRFGTCQTVPAGVLPGSDTAVRLVQPSNMPSLIQSTGEGISISFSAVQPANALLPMLSTLSGMVISCKL